MRTKTSISPRLGHTSNTLTPMCRLNCASAFRSLNRSRASTGLHARRRYPSCFPRGRRGHARECGKCPDACEAIWKSARVRQRAVGRQSTSSSARPGLRPAGQATEHARARSVFENRKHFCAYFHNICICSPTWRCNAHTCVHCMWRSGTEPPTHPQSASFHAIRITSGTVGWARQRVAKVSATSRANTIAHTSAVHYSQITRPTRVDTQTDTHTLSAWTILFRAHVKCAQTIDGLC